MEYAVLRHSLVLCDIAVYTLTLTIYKYFYNVIHSNI